MACMPIEIVRLGGVPEAAVLEAVSEANSRQRQFLYSLMPPSDSERFGLLAFNDIYGPKFLDRMAEIRAEIRGYHPYIIAFVDGQLSGERLSNLFAHDRPEAGLGVATIANVPDVILPAGKLNAYVVHRLAKQTLSFIAPHHKNHNDTRDCVYDMKIRKLDLLRSMRARAFCDECRNALLTTSLSPAQLSALDGLLAASGQLLQEPAVSPVRLPRVFIGSSSEGLAVANAVQSLLHRELTVEVWNQGTVFGLGHATLEDLESAALTYDFGIFIFTPDDQLDIRDKRQSVARDNVLFEFGLFVGKLSRRCAFIIRSPAVSLPSDLAGITTASYDPTAPNITAALGPACEEIRGAVRRAAKEKTAVSGR